MDKHTRLNVSILMSMAADLLGQASRIAEHENLFDTNTFALALRSDAKSISKTAGLIESDYEALRYNPIVPTQSEAVLRDDGGLKAKLPDCAATGPFMPAEGFKAKDEAIIVGTSNGYAAVDNIKKGSYVRIVPSGNEPPLVKKWLIEQDRIAIVTQKIEDDPTPGNSGGKNFWDNGQSLKAKQRRLASENVVINDPNGKRA